MSDGRVTGARRNGFSYHMHFVTQCPSGMKERSFVRITLVSAIPALFSIFSFLALGEITPGGA